MQGSARATIARGSPSRARIRRAGRAWVVSTLALAIAAVLAVLFWPRRIVCGSTAKVRVDIEAIQVALHTFAADHAGRYPSSLSELLVPDAKGERYLNARRGPCDPWKQEYRYEPSDVASGHDEPHVWSLGKDGISGTEDDVDSRAIEGE